MFDRALQRRLLEELAEHYPTPIHPKCIPDANELARNLRYLEEHGLVAQSMTQIGPHPISRGTCITAHGLDFLADDGGLSAVLGVVTIKFHEDTLRQMMEMRIEQSDLPAAEKRRWTDALRELPAESIKHLSTKLMDAAFEKAPAGLALLATYLGMG